MISTLPADSTAFLNDFISFLMFRRAIKRFGLKASEIEQFSSCSIWAGTGCFVVGAARRFGTLFFWFSELISSGSEFSGEREREGFVSEHCEQRRSPVQFPQRERKSERQGKKRQTLRLPMSHKNVAAWIHKHTWVSFSVCMGEAHQNGQFMFQSSFTSFLFFKCYLQ